MSSLPTYIDLFAGAGGLSEGFIRAGYEPIAHVEFDEAACYTLKTRLAYYHLKNTNNLEPYFEYLKGKITRKVLYSFIPDRLLSSVINKTIGKDNEEIFSLIDDLKEKKKVDFIIGGPPCQAYSLVGRARSEDGMRHDPRNHLYVEYGKFLEKFQPRFFVFENVLGLKSAKKGTYLTNIEKLFFKKGYKIKLYTVSANNFGVLQNRKRIIILGWKKESNYELPDFERIRTLSDYKVEVVFNDLPPIKAGEGVDRFCYYQSDLNGYLKQTLIRNGIDILTQHVARPNTDQDKRIYRIAVNKWNSKKERLDYNDLPDVLKTHKNRHSFFDRFKVVASDLPYSQTVVAHIAKDGHYYIHPDLDQNRSISVREAARLQSFPDDYYFEGVKELSNRTAAYKQIGNAVPPLMAEKIAEVLKMIL
jgi:DNA (cytosine-5)-methyltransferase 1